MCDKQYLPFRRTSASNLLKILTPIFQYYLWHYVIHREISDFCVLLLCISLSRSCWKEKKINRKSDVVDHDLCMKYFLFHLLYTIYITDDSRAKRYRAVGYYPHAVTATIIYGDKNDREISLDPFFFTLIPGSRCHERLAPTHPLLSVRFIFFDVWSTGFVIFHSSLSLSFSIFFL